MPKILIVQCKKCGHKMKYMPSSMILTGKKKPCVYCGHSISVSQAVVKAL